MVSLLQLWLPIVLGGVLVFFTSSLIHMVFRWHNSDYRKLPEEDEVRAVLRKAAPSPGQYALPHCLGPKEAQAPEMQQKFAEGPVAVLRLLPNGVPAMGPMLGKWFALNLLVCFVTAYVAANTLAPGAAPLQVLRVTATIGFLAYAVGGLSEAIWMGKPWSAAAKDLLDALLYGLAGGAAFAWLWPGPAA